MPTEVTHDNIQPTIDLTMGVYGRDLGHVADDVAKVVDEFGEPDEAAATGRPYDPTQPRSEAAAPARKIVLSGEYPRMQDTFRNLGFGLILASLLIYFLMVGLDKSLVVPLTVMLIVPLCLVGILPMLYLTGTAVNVQSLLGFIFIVGIKVANTVLMTDFAQELRRHEGLTPTAGDPQGGVDPRPAGDDDGPGGVLRADSGGASRSSGAARRTPPAGPRHPRRPARRRAGHAVRAARALFAVRPRFARAG